MADLENSIRTRLSVEGADDVRKQLDIAFKGIQNGQKAIYTSMKETNGVLEKTSISAMKTTDGWTNLSSSISKSVSSIRRFKMEWLSVLFFSTMVQRTIQKTIMNSISVFSEISGSANKSAQAIAIVGAQMKYLQFTLGAVIADALEPMLPLIIGIVDKLVDFIEQNPEAVFWGIATALGIFTTGALVGNLVLFTDSLLTIISKVDPAKLTEMANALKLLRQAAGIGGMIYFGMEALDSLKNGEVLESLSNVAFMAASYFGLVKGDWKTGLLMVGIAFALKFLDDPTAVLSWFGTLTGYVAGYATKLGTTIGDLIMEGFISSLTGKTPDFSNIFSKWEGEWASMQDSFIAGFEKSSGLTVQPGESGAMAIMAQGSKNTDELIQKYGVLDQTGTQTMANLVIATNPLLSLISNISKLFTGSGEGEASSGSSVVSSIGATETAFSTMTTNSNTKLKTTLDAINALNKTVVTTHIIKTIREDSGGSTSAPSRQFGGWVPREGLYHLHGGEMVVNPAYGNVTNVGGLSINVSAQTNANADMIASVVSDVISTQFNQYY